MLSFGISVVEFGTQGLRGGGFTDEGLGICDWFKDVTFRAQGSRVFSTFNSTLNP